MSREYGTMNNKEYGFFFGISLSSLSKKEILSFVRSIVTGNSLYRIATVGPEFLLRAREDRMFRENLLKADLRIADGVGITIAGWLSGRRIPHCPGADLLSEILKEAEARNLSVFLAIRKSGLSSLEEIQTALFKKYPRLKTEGKEFVVSDSIPHSPFPIPHSNIVFSNFGAPHQEYFLESLRGQANEVKLAMGVGGAFDFLTGKLPRAPKALRAIGLEWFWRLILQPSRWKRIWRAVVVFPVAVIRKRFFPNRHSREGGNPGATC